MVVVTVRPASCEDDKWLLVSCPAGGFSTHPAELVVSERMAWYFNSISSKRYSSNLSRVPNAARPGCQTVFFQFFKLYILMHLTLMGCFSHTHAVHASVHIDMPGVLLKKLSSWNHKAQVDKSSTTHLKRTACCNKLQVVSYTSGATGNEVINPRFEQWVSGSPESPLAHQGLRVVVYLNEFIKKKGLLKASKCQFFQDDMSMYFLPDQHQDQKHYDRKSARLGWTGRR